MIVSSRSLTRIVWPIADGEPREVRLPVIVRDHHDRLGAGTLALRPAVMKRPADRLQPQRA